MNYAEVLEKAWKIIWKFKVLWIFGFFASCAGGGGGGGGGGSGGSNFSTSSSGSGNGGGFPGNMPFPEIGRFFAQLGRTLASIPPWVYIAVGLSFLLLMIVIALLVQAISTIGRIGLVRGAWQADEGVDKLSFSPLFKESLPYFWRVFLLHFLTGLLIFIIVMIALIPLIAIIIIVASAANSAANVILWIVMAIIILFFIAMMCILVPVSWVIAVVLELATIAIAGEGCSLMGSLKRAWEVIRSKPGPIILMALILMIGSGIAGLLISLPAIVVALPLIFGAIFGALSGSPAIIGAGVIIFALLFLVYLPVALLLRSVIEAYLRSAWTLTFRRLTIAATA